METDRRRGAGAALQLSFADLAPIEDVAGFVERPGGPAAPIERLAGFLEGSEDATPFHSPEDVRRHWFAKWRRRVGYGAGGDYDNVVLVSARFGKGEGKSTLALEAGLELDRSITPASLPGRVAFSAAEFLEILPGLKRGQVASYDEAVLGLLSTEFWSEESRTLVKAVAIARDIHATVFLCVPSIGIFNPQFRRSMVDYWIQVRERGTAVVHEKPGERYTEYRGIGWFPDREWNPYTWPRLRGPVWDAYRRRRRAARLSAHAELRSRLEEREKGERGASRAPPPPRASTKCPKCGREFGRTDHVDRHLRTVHR